MINVSAAWMQSLYDDKRDYQVHIKITLKDNTVLNLSNENIWGGSLLLDDAVSNDNDLQLGAAIINKMSVTINNIYGTYDAYDFNGARVELKIGLIIDGAEEKINKGKYIVNNATYNGQLIALECYDYMYFFDVSYSDSGQTFPATIDNIVRNCCTDVGVPLNTYNFPHKNFTIEYIPDKTKTTYREIISWCAQICGCFARCNNNGQLEFKWYDFATLDQTAVSFLNGGVFDENTPYSTGNTADGGRFNPWNLGDVYDGGGFNWNNSVHTISSVYRLNVSVDDVIITRIQAVVKVEDAENHSESEKAYNIGTEGYTVEIRSNPFITENNVSEILSWLGTQLIGVKYRKANISHASNPSIEAGDCAVVFDRKNTVYPIIISRTSFSTGGSQNTISAAQTPLRNSATRFSTETKNYVDLRERIKNERTTRKQIEAQLAEDIANSNGMYKTETVEDGATKYYLHNKPLLNDSAIRILFSDVGITVTANGLDPNPSWYGLRVNGDLISRILTATGINADWINAGELTSQDKNQNFSLNLNTGKLTMKSGSINIANKFIVDQYGNTTLSSATITGYATNTSVTNTLTQYPTKNDLKTSNTTIIDGSNITTGTIKSQGTRPNFSLNLNTGELTMKSGSINIADKFIVDTYGNATLSSATITGSPSISGYATQNDLSAYPLKTNLSNGTTKIDGSCIQTGRIQAAFLDLSGVASIDSLKNGTTTINGGCITTGVIQDSPSSPKFKIDFTNKKIEIKQGEINLGNGNFIVDNDGNVTMKKGSITIGSNKNFEVTKDGSVTMKNATINGYLTENSVSESGTTQISGKRIITGSIDAEKLSVKFLTATDVGSSGKTVINGSRISTGIIKSSNENVVFNLDNGSLKMNSGSININKNFIVDKEGNATFKGTVTINGSPSISGYVSNTSLSNSLSGYATKEGLKNSGYTSIHGGNLVNFSISTYKIDTGAITADKIYSGAVTTDKLDTGAVTAKKIQSGTITSDKIESTVSLAGTFQTKGSSQITKISNGVLSNTNTSGSNLFRLYTSSVSTTYPDVILHTWSKYGTLFLGVGIDFENSDNYIEINRYGINLHGKSVSGIDKSRIVKTDDYDTRTVYCYETSSPMFGDLGDGIIADDGFCYINIDSVFSEMINDDNYQIYLQEYGDGKCYVYSKFHTYFIVCGTPKLKFGWEIKAKQFDSEHKRLDVYTMEPEKPYNYVNYNTDSEELINMVEKKSTYGEDALKYIQELQEERIIKK